MGDVRQNATNNGACWVSVSLINVWVNVNVGRALTPLNKVFGLLAFFYSAPAVTDALLSVVLQFRPCRGCVWKYWKTKNAKRKLSLPPHPPPTPQNRRCCTNFDSISPRKWVILPCLLRKAPQSFIIYEREEKKVSMKAPATNEFDCVFPSAPLELHQY